jgi:tripartite-type tricarboxylate transporter receptor subunit TctC
MNKKIIHHIVAGMALVMAATTGGAVFAAGNYPDKPIRLIVAFPPGGPADITARIITPKLSALLGQSVVIENRGGAGGNVGAQAVAKAAPDGYTLLATTTSFAVNPSLWGKDAGYEAKDFVPVSIVTTQPNAISVHQSLGVNTIEELHALAMKKHLAFATPGSGTTPQLTGENLFRVIWKSNMTTIPYKGAGPAVAAINAGEPPVASTAVAGVLPFVKSGRVKVLAVSSRERIPSLPDVPTLYELGYKDILDYTWTGILAPAGTPQEIVDKLASAIDQVSKSPDLKENFDGQAMIVVGGSSKDFADYLQTELTRWARIVKETDAKPE